MLMYFACISHFLVLSLSRTCKEKNSLKNSNLAVVFKVIRMALVHDIWMIFYDLQRVSS